VPIPLCSLQLTQDRSRTEEHLDQSLPYLQDVQPSLQDAAIRFISEPQPPVPLLAAWPQGTVLPRGHPAGGGRVCSQAGRAGGRAAGSVLGSAGSDESFVPRACRAAPEGPT